MGGPSRGPPGSLWAAPVGKSDCPALPPVGFSYSHIPSSTPTPVAGSTTIAANTRGVGDVRRSRPGAPPWQAFWAEQA